MATEKQIQTARENGKKSHGPASDDGRTASSRNAVTHGLRSTKWLVRNAEDQALLDALLEAFNAEYQPSNATQTVLVRDLALNRFALERVWAMQVAGIDAAVEDMRPGLAKYNPECDEPTRLYLAFNRIGCNSPSLALLNRYQVSHDRAFHRARKALLESPLDSGNFQTNPPPDAAPPTSLQE